MKVSICEERSQRGDKMKMIKMVKICFAVMMIGICVSCGSGQGKKRDLSVMTVTAHFGKTEKDIRSWLEMKQEDMTLVRKKSQNWLNLFLT